MNTNELNEYVLNELLSLADNFVAQVKGMNDGMYNAAQIVKEIGGKAAYEGEDGERICEINAGDFHAKLRFDSVLNVLYRWESMMNVKHRRWEIGAHKERRRFFCHFADKTNNAVRRSIELTRLDMPCLEGRPNEIWYFERNGIADLYSRLSDTECLLVMDKLYTKLLTESSGIIMLASDVRSEIMKRNCELPSFYINAFIMVRDYEVVNHLAQNKVKFEAEREEKKRREELMYKEWEIKKAKESVESLKRMAMEYEEGARQAQEKVERMEEELRRMRAAV